MRPMHYPFPKTWSQFKVSRQNNLIFAFSTLIFLPLLAKSVCRWVQVHLKSEPVLQVTVPPPAGFPVCMFVWSMPLQTLPKKSSYILCFLFSFSKSCPFLICGTYLCSQYFELNKTHETELDVLPLTVNKNSHTLITFLITHKQFRDLQSI